MYNAYCISSILTNPNFSFLLVASTFHQSRSTIITSIFHFLLSSFWNCPSLCSSIHLISNKKLEQLQSLHRSGYKMNNIMFTLIYPNSYLKYGFHFSWHIGLFPYHTTLVSWHGSTALLTFINQCSLFMKWTQHHHQSHTSYSVSRV